MGTDAENYSICATEIPTTETQLGYTLETPTGIALLTVYVIITIATWALFLEEVVFLTKVMPNDLDRRSVTTWILGLFPAFSSAGLFGYIIPRSACICDLAANVYMALSLYAVLLLMIDYLGGTERIGSVVKHYSPLKVRTSTLPLCCCCLCLPEFILTRETFMRMRTLVLQCAVVRPMVMFVMAVFWTNGWYKHGEMDPLTAGFYLHIINIITTISGVWGANICKSAFGEILAEFRIAQKLLMVMAVLLTTLFVPIIIGIVIMAGGVSCTPYTTARGAGDAIYRGVLVFTMLFFGVVARFLFRNAEDVHQLKVLDEIQHENKGRKRDSDEFVAGLPNVIIEFEEKDSRLMSASTDEKCDQVEKNENGAPPPSERNKILPPTPETSL